MVITNEGDSQSFAFTGAMQSFTAPQKGIYKLEVWGAQGGNGGGLGGYSYGHVLLEKDAVLYVCCGQAGAISTATTYNGGGGGRSKYFNFTDHYKPTRTGGSGGGATHIATRSGTLAELGSTSGLLIAAGGGGGGLYGGCAQTVTGNHRDAASCGGGGGSGYTGGVPDLTHSGTTYAHGMLSGQRSGSGYAVITFVKKGELPVVFDGAVLQKILFGGAEVGSLVVNGTKVFMRKLQRRLSAWPWRMKQAAA